MGLFSFFTNTRKPNNPLSLHDTLSGETLPFEPISNTVRMYNCGPTVYDRQHIGNVRAAIVADLLRRTLAAWGYKVKQVINITDVGHLQSDADEGEDKMTAGLKREGKALTLENMQEMGERFTQAYFNDIDAVGVDRSSITFPRASAYIAEQIKLVRTLINKGVAYEGPSGVYFEVSKFPTYGKLGNINLSGLQEGARVETNQEKRGPYDFLLWKKDTKLGWHSPWGTGFPGWHTECVAMIFALLGEQIDIHTGGIEHIPIHHNNEIAQAQSASGKAPFARYWIHHDHATLNGTKISKSLGNTIYISDIAERGLPPMALRYLYLTAHYRSPINITWEALEGAAAALKKLQRAYLAAPEGTVDEKFLSEFYTAVGDDLDTPKAVALIWSNIDQLSKATLREADKVLGLGLKDIKTEAVPAEVKKLADEREAARNNKDFARSDELRAQIEQMGWDIKDTPQGPQISKK